MMRVFKDRYAGRTQGEALLLVSDCMAIASAVVFAAGWHGGSEAAVRLGALALWALLPRVVAPFVGLSLREGGYGRTFGAAVVVVFGVLLFTYGLGLLGEHAAASGQSLLGVRIMTLAACVVGFFLFLRPLYWIHDLLIVGLVIHGLAADQPHPRVFVSIFLVGMAISFAVRFQLHHVFRHVTRPRLNLQNARVLALMLVIVTGAVFAVLVRSGAAATIAVTPLGGILREVPGGEVGVFGARSRAR